MLEEKNDTIDICINNAGIALGRSNRNHSLTQTIYILDEASMLSTMQGHELIKLVEQKGARLLLIGDKDQLSSVKCGRILGKLKTMEFKLQK